jgi:hypothetical protein
MKNRLLAQLDRLLERRGEMVVLRRQVGTGGTVSYVQAHIPAIVRTLTMQQIVAGISATNYMIIISPTHIDQQKWPGGKTSTVVPGSILDPLDIRIPLINSDNILMRGRSQVASRVAPVFDAGICVRIEMNVVG